MIWLTWRQARAQTLIAVGALGVLAIYLVFLGRGIHDYSADHIVGCSGSACAQAIELFSEKYLTSVSLSGLLLIAIPGLIGVFWGAPLITRELENGTHRLAWNQSVTRTRWLAVKLAVLAVIAVLITGATSWLLTWAAAPFDRVVGSRFSAATFDSRDIVPLGYAVFAFVLGITAGLLVRRTLPAMALTLTVFATLMIVMPLAVRPHLMTPVTTTVTFTTEVAEQIHGFGTHANPGKPESESQMGIFDGLQRPGDWMLSSAFTPLLHADGSPYTLADNRPCMTGEFRKDMACVAGENLHFDVTYHPASRYWAFQWIEAAVFLTLALLLAGVAFWRVRRVG